MDGINLGGGLFGFGLPLGLGGVESELVWEGGLVFARGWQQATKEHRHRQEAYSRLLSAAVRTFTVSSALAIR